MNVNRLHLSTRLFTCSNSNLQIVESDTDKDIGNRLLIVDKADMLMESLAATTLTNADCDMFPYKSYTAYVNKTYVKPTKDLQPIRDLRKRRSKLAKLSRKINRNSK